MSSGRINKPHVWDPCVFDNTNALMVKKSNRLLFLELIRWSLSLSLFLSLFLTSFSLPISTSLYECSKTELWLTLCDLAKSYKLGQSTLARVQTGLLEFWVSLTEIFEHKHMLNRCCTGASPQTCAQLCLLAGALDQWSGNLKLTNTFSIDAAQAQICSHVCGLTLQLGLRLAPQKVYLWRFSSFLEIFNRIPFLSLYGLENLIKFQRRSWSLFDFLK